MSAELIAKYLEARAALLAAENRVLKVIAPISSAATALRNWDQVMISNTSVGFPMDIALTHKPTLNAREWPTLDQVAEALAASHDARHKAENAWHAIPSDLQAGLQPLPKPQQA